MTQLRNQETGQVSTANEVEREIRQHTSAPAVIDFTQFGYDVVFPTPAPTYNHVTESYREIAPAQINGKWYQTYEVVPRFTEYTDDEGVTHTVAEQEAAAIAADLAAKQAALISSVTASTQQRLDDFAKSRNYDGILSACTYASSAIPKFQAEGQYCVNARDATWATLYTVMAEVEAGTRPVPTGYADIEPLLPVLEWPV